MSEASPGQLRELIVKTEALRAMIPAWRVQATIACALNPTLWIAVHGVPLHEYLSKLDDLDTNADEALKKLREELAKASPATAPEGSVVVNVNIVGDRQTFEVPPGFEAVKDAEGRATGEVRLAANEGQGAMVHRSQDRGQPPSVPHEEGVPEDLRPMLPHTGKEDLHKLRPHSVFEVRTRDPQKASQWGKDWKWIWSWQSADPNDIVGYIEKDYTAAHEALATAEVPKLICENCGGSGIVRTVTGISQPLAADGTCPICDGTGLAPK